MCQNFNLWGILNSRQLYGFWLQFWVYHWKAWKSRGFRYSSPLNFLFIFLWKFQFSYYFFCDDVFPNFSLRTISSSKVFILGGTCLSSTLDFFKTKRKKNCGTLKIYTTWDVCGRVTYGSLHGVACVKCIFFNRIWIIIGFFATAILSEVNTVIVGSYILNLIPKNYYWS